MDRKGSKTEKNLLAAFAGESQARNKYNYFASVAKKEGYEQISEIFAKTADNEKEHAKMWFKARGALGNTAQNLLCLLYTSASGGSGSCPPSPANRSPFERTSPPPDPPSGPISII